MSCRTGFLFVVEQKETKNQHKGFAPMYPKGQGRVTTILHLIPCTGAKPLTPDVIVLKHPMVKGGGCRRIGVLLNCAQKNFKKFPFPY